MSVVQRSALAAALLLGMPCAAEDLWDPAFKLSVGSFSGAQEAHLGKDQLYGLTAEGGYPLFRNGSLVLELGYRQLPHHTQVEGQDSVDAKTYGWLGSALYRHSLGKGFWTGLFVQGGLRLTQMQSQADVVMKGAGPSGEDLLTHHHGDKTQAVSLVLGVGFRFDEKLSLELGLSKMKAENYLGQELDKTVLEFSLGIHL